MKYKLALLFAAYLLLPTWYAILPEHGGLLALFGGQVCAQEVQNEDKPEKVGFWDQLRVEFSKKQDQDCSILDKKFASDTLLVYPGAYIDSRQYKLGRYLMAYRARAIICVAGIFLSVFIIGGLVGALFDWRVRKIFFQNKTLRLIYSMAALSVLLWIYAFYSYVAENPLLDGNHLFALGVGLTLVWGTPRVVGYFFEKWTKNLP